MKKHDSVKQADKDMQDALRAGSNANKAVDAILLALPPSANYLRVSTMFDPKRPENGRIELEVLSFNDAMALREHFPPLPMMLVRKDNGRIPLVTFYPAARVTDAVFERGEAEQVYSALFQMYPPSGGRKHPTVMLDWYTRLADGLIINVRAKVAHHGCYYSNRKAGDWLACCVPRGIVRRVNIAGRENPPAVTIYWPMTLDHTRITDDKLLLHLLTQAPTQDA